MAISDKANTALQAQYDKLRATGLSQADATAQIKANLKDIGAFDTLKAQNTTATPVATIPTPEATPNITSPVPTNGETFLSPEQIKQNAFDAANPVGTQLTDVKNETQAQVDTATQQATFNAPAPTTDTTTVETKKTATGSTTSTTAPKEAPVDFNVGVGREQDILNHLNDGYANDPKINKAIVSGDIETFKTAYQYETADPTKKKMLDAFFNARQPKTEDAFFNVLRSGNSITNSDILAKPEFKLAQQRWNDFKKYSSYSSSQLSSVLKSGQLLPGSKGYNDLLLDPVASARLKEAQIFNSASGNSIDLLKTGENQTADILSNNITTANALADGQISGDEYKSMLQTPEITNKQKEVEVYKTKYDTLKADYDNVELAVESELKGTGATTSYKNALIADRRKGMYRDLQVATDTYNNSLGTLSDMQKTQASIVDMNFKLYQTAEQRTYEAKQAELQQNREFDLKYGDITSKDPRVQQVAAERMAEQIQSQYKGLPFRRTVPEMAKDIISELNSGKSLDQISTDIQNAVKSKEEYTTYAQAAGLTKAPAKVDFMEFDNKLIKTDSEGNYSIIATGTPKASDVKNWEKVGDYYQNPEDNSLWSQGDIEQAKIANNAYLKKGEGEIGGDCGFFASRATGLGSTPGGNSLSDRKAQFSEKTPVPGGMVFFYGGGYDKTYGHIAVVTSVNADGTINVKESNFNNNQKVSERKNVPTTYVKGFYNNTPLAGGTTSGGNSGIVGTILASGKFTKDQSEAIKNGINSGEDPFTVIKNQAKGIMPSPVATDTAQLESARDSMKSLDGYLKEYYSKGGSTDLLSGTMEEVTNKLGEVNDPKKVEIATKVARALQKYRNAISGTAYSNQEGQEISKVFPSIKKGEILNNSIVKANISSMTDDIDSAYRNVIGKAYDELKPKETQSEAQPKQENNMKIEGNKYTFTSKLPYAGTHSGTKGDGWNDKYAAVVNKGLQTKSWDKEAAKQWLIKQGVKNTSLYLK